MRDDEMQKRIAAEEKSNRIPIDPVRMFLRTLDQYDELMAKFHDLEVKFTQHQNDIAERFRDQNATIEGLVGRMNGQVSNTGHKNSEDIQKLNTKMEKIDTQLFDEDTGLIKQFLAGKRAMYGTMGTGIIALIAWLWQHFFNGK
jgi:hypothetical protein